MDKYEFNIKVEQIKKLVNKKDFATAMKIADTIDWRRVRNANLLSMISQVYEKNREYQEAKEVLLLAFERAPIGKRLLYKLTELALREGSVAEAEDYYREFCDLAPEDTRQYILRYMLLKEKKAPIDQLIHALERYTAVELDEKWLYELAELYERAGRTKDCVQLCDKMILMFGVGTYVERAMELKQRYAPLNQYQQGLAQRQDHYGENPHAVGGYGNGAAGMQIYEEQDRSGFGIGNQGDLSAGIDQGYMYGAGGNVPVSAGYAQDRNGYAQPEGSYMTGAGNYTQPEGGYMAGAGNYVQPGGGYTAGAGNYAQPEDGYTAGAGTYAQPEGGYTAGAGNYVRPEGGYTVGAGNYVQSEGGYTVGAGTYAQPEGSYIAGTGNYAQPEGSYTAGVGNYAQPEGGYLAGTGNYAQPETDYAGGAGNYTQPGNSYISGSGNYVQPEGGYAAGSRSYVQPENGYGAEAGNYAQPEDGYVPGNENYMQPEGGSYSQFGGGYVSEGGNHMQPDRGYVPVNDYTQPDGSYTAETKTYSQSESGYASGARNYVQPESGYAAGAGSYGQPQDGYRFGAGNYAGPGGGYVPGAGSYAQPGGGYVPGAGNHVQPEGGYVPGAGSYAQPGGSYGSGAGSYVQPEGGYVPGTGNYVQSEGDYAAGARNYVSRDNSYAGRGENYVHPQGNYTAGNENYTQPVNDRSNNRNSGFYGGAEGGYGYTDGQYMEENGSYGSAADGAYSEDEAYRSNNAYPYQRDNYIDEEIVANLHQAVTEKELAAEMSRISPEGYVEQEPQSGRTKVFRQRATNAIAEAVARRAAEKEKESRYHDRVYTPHHLMIEAKSPEVGFEKAVEILKKIHQKTGVNNQVIKISGSKLSNRGVFNVSDKLAGKDLIVEEAGDLRQEDLEELQVLLERDETGMIVVLIDNPYQIEELHHQNPGFINLFKGINADAEDSESGLLEEVTEEESAQETDAGYDEESAEGEGTEDEASGEFSEADSDDIDSEEESSEDESQEEDQDFDSEENDEAEYESEEEYSDGDDAEYAEENDGYDAEYEEDAEYETEDAGEYDGEYTEDAEYETEDEGEYDGEYTEEDEYNDEYEDEYSEEEYNEEEYEEEQDYDGEQDVEDEYERPVDDEELDLNDFADYAVKYANEIDCSITGKSMLALYERIEIMEEDGIPLTRSNAEDLIEEAADKAEKPSIGGLIKGVFSSKYDKDGLLILKEEHFI